MTVRISLATEADRRQIYRLRHDVYALELGQHSPHADSMLCDSLDEHNMYIVAKSGDQVIGFVSITLPNPPSYSIDNYFERDELPFAFDDGLFELRILTVAKPHRTSRIALVLMHAALRWVEASGGRRVVIIGREDLVPMYEKAGFVSLERTVVSGALRFLLMSETVTELRRKIDSDALLPEQLRQARALFDWDLPIEYFTPASCYHGGSFFDAIGDGFASLERRHDVVNADVLDAWFDPSPKVVQAIEEHLPWMLQCAPPTDCGGLVHAIARARQLPAASILVGAGSSDLIYLAMREWLRPGSRTLILDPMYGEYAHLIERVHGGSLSRFPLRRADGYSLDTEAFVETLQQGFDFVIIVNPNNPTGQIIERAVLNRIIDSAPSRTTFWIDEAYIPFAGDSYSMEHVAASSRNVFVCKSMSKGYALSGARAAYLVGPAHRLERLRSLTPPWAVSLPAQVAAVKALEDPEYYAARYRETDELRDYLVANIATLFPEWEIFPGIANFVLFHLPDSGPTAEQIVADCQKRGVFLRDAKNMSASLGDYALRIAVKSQANIDRILDALTQCKSLNSSAL